MYEDEDFGGKRDHKAELHHCKAELESHQTNLKQRREALGFARTEVKKIKAERDSLIDDIAVVRANNEELERELAAALNGELATYDKLQEYVLELQGELAECLEENRNLDKALEKAVSIAESENSKVLKLEHENKALRLQADTYFDEWQSAETYIDAIKTYYPMYERLRKQYNILTDHIRMKAKANPNIDLVNLIDRLEQK